MQIFEEVLFLQLCKKTKTKQQQQLIQLILCQLDVGGWWEEKEDFFFYPFIPLSVTLTVFQGHSEKFMFLSDYVETLYDY